MKFFGRNTDPQAVAVELQPQPLDETTALLGAACVEGYCAEADPAGHELSEKQEELLGSLYKHTDDWVAELETARVKVGEYKADFDSREAEAAKAVGMNHQSRREHMRASANSTASNLAIFRQQAQQDVNLFAVAKTGFTSVQQIVRASAKVTGASHTAFNAMRKLRFVNDVDHSRGKWGVGVATYGEDRMLNPYHRVFAQEASTRLQFAFFTNVYPSIAASLLSPANLANLPDSMQQFVATELAYGKNSQLMDFLVTHQQKKTTLFEYLNGNELSPSAKEAALAIGVGAQALNGCECPLNAFGICRTVTDGITGKGLVLPKSITDDAERKQQTATATLLAQLNTFAATNKVHPAWAMDTVITPQAAVPDSNPRTNKKRQPAATSTKATERSLAESLVPPLRKPELAPPERLEVAWRESEGLHEVPLADTESVSAIVEAMMLSEQVQDYIKGFRHEKNLTDFMRVALQTILTTPQYRTEPSIRPMLGGNIKNIYSAVDRAQRLNLYRLSGRDLRGNFAGRSGFKLRIFFGVNHTGETRRVELRDVVSKDDIEKKIRRLSV